MTRRAAITMPQRLFVSLSLLAAVVSGLGLNAAAPAPTTGALALVAVASLVMIAVAHGRIARAVAAVLLGLRGSAPSTPPVPDVERCAIRQSDPDAAGHARPRAPGALFSVVRGQLH